VQTVNRYNERSRYLSGLFAWLSYGRCSWVPVARRERQHGRSKYNVVQLVRLVLTLITSWSTRPLHLALGAGAFVMGIGGLVGLYWLYLVATHGWSAGGLVLLAAALILLAGVQLLAMGIIGDYIGKIYNEVRERPQYVIADIYQREKEHDA
jgi:polyisoprenyl-phosphate glycosyltransferase